MSEATPQALTPAPPVAGATEAPVQLMQGGEAHHYALTLFTRSPNNPRTRFSESYIEELATSIKRLGGVIQPILARPNPDYVPGNGRPPYEIVCGECRYRASVKADMAGILAMVRPLTDFDVQEVQIVENLHRNDLHPLEEAEGLQRLLRAPDGLQGYDSVEELAARLGKSRRWVYGRLQLLQLSEPVRIAFFEDRIKATVAGLIARMPDATQQAEALARIEAGFGGESMSFRQAAEYLQKDFMLNLAKARFDIKSAYQCAGPCGQCPKRSGANPDLFEDVTAGDMCQDRACFDAKTEEAHQAVLAGARAIGCKVLAGAEARQLMPSASMLPTGYQWFDKPCPKLTASKRTLRELFGTKLRDLVVVDHPQTETIIELMPDAAVKKMLKAKDLLRDEPAPAPAPAPTAAPAMSYGAAPAPKPVPVKPRSDQQLEAAMAERAGDLFSHMLFKRMHDQLASAEQLPSRAAELLVLQRVEDNMSAEAIELMYDVRGWDLPDRQTAYLSDLATRLRMLDGHQVGLLLIETLYAEELTNSDTLGDLRTNFESYALEVAELLEIELPPIQAEADEGAYQQVSAEERRRLGMDTDDEGEHDDATDASAAFVAVHAPKPSASKVPVKYRNASTGESWSGRGLQPKWLKVAIGEGARLEDFEVTP